MQLPLKATFDVAGTAPVHLDMAGEVWSLVIDPDISWDAARAHIADDFSDRADELHGRSLRLDLGGRTLDLMEVRRISTLLRDGFKAAIIGIECSPEAVHRYAESAFKMPLIAPALDTRPRMPLVFTGAPFAAVEPEPENLQSEDEMSLADGAVATDLPQVKDALEAVAESAFLDGLVTGLEETDHLIEVECTDIIEPDGTLPSEAGRRVMVVEKTLRSGKTIRFAGDVMVYGDVNAGAHIEADGNIIVFGSLRGLAHAGARGDGRAVILSFDLGATQLRIASHIGVVTEAPVDSDLPADPQGFAKVRGDLMGSLGKMFKRAQLSSRDFKPEIAWVEGGEIRIGSYQGRLPA
jgi:septum site-determining protein MinC